MKRTLYMAVMLLVATLAATDVQAQKWPERSRVRRGNRAYERLDYDRAEERYQQALELSDSCFEAKFNLGDALYKQQRYDEAEKIFAALAADSTRSDLDRAHSYYNLGNSLFQQQKYQEALAAFKRSLRLNPADLETKYNYAYTKKYIEDNQQGGGGGGGNNNQNQQNDQNQDQNQQGGGQNDQQNDQNQDQNKDQNQQGNDDQNKDQNQDNQNNDDQNKDNQDPNKDDQQNDQQGDNEPKEGENDPQQGDGDQEPQPSGLSQNDAERMLDAIQGEEDKTRDKVNAKVGQGVVRSGKNW